MAVIKILCFSLLISACADKNLLSLDRINAQQLNAYSEGIFVAKYGDFGPPQLASKLLGNKWWQWDDPDNYKPVTYDVNVVVYRNHNLETIKQAFPVIPGKKQDYRYVEYEKASEYFAANIREFEQEMLSYDNPEDLGMMCIYPLNLYKTALAMEIKILK